MTEVKWSLTGLFPFDLQKTNIFSYIYLPHFRGYNYINIVEAIGKGKYRLSDTSIIIETMEKLV